MRSAYRLEAGTPVRRLAFCDADSRGRNRRSFAAQQQMREHLSPVMPLYVWLPRYKAFRRCEVGAGQGRLRSGANRQWNWLEVGHASATTFTASAQSYEGRDIMSSPVHITPCTSSSSNLVVYARRVMSAPSSIVDKVCLGYTELTNHEMS